ncbi:MAG: hypothetical protein MUP76_11130 [Acidimicrobiia bacterium]|nr:hypothetical protein [Acidimicrobiia bacterium]
MFHVTTDGETTVPLSDFEIGVLVGILVGEGSFGGDGRQPQITLRMHIRHRALFTWMTECLPGGRLYGPYHHGGRSYYQWMARGTYLKEVLVPLLDRYLTPDVDEYACERYLAMKDRYGIGQSTGAGEITTQRRGSSPSE